MSRYAAIYARTSREFKNQEKISVDQQIESARALAEKAGYTVLPEHVFIDRDLSGKLPPKQFADGQRKCRPGLTKLLDGIANRDFGCVIIRKRDRLFRNTVLALRFYEYLRDHNCGVSATDENLPAGTDGTGRFTLTVLAAAAELQLEQFREQTKATKAYAKRHGAKLGPVQAIGYRDADHARGEIKGTVIIDEKTTTIVREIFAKFVAGSSGYQIVQWLEETYPRHKSMSHLSNNLVKQGRWHLGPLTRLLRNSHYIGMDELDGQLVPSKHYKAIIPTELYWQAQKILANRKGTYIRRTPRAYETAHLLTGLLKCGYHQCNMVAMKRKHDGGHFHYCLLPHAHRQRTILEPLWLEWVMSFFAPQFMLNHHSKLNPMESMTRVKIETIEINAAKLKKRFSTGEIDTDIYVGAAELAKEELARLYQQLSAMPPADRTPTTPWDDMTFDQRREALKQMIDRIEVFSDHAVVHFQHAANRNPQTFPFMKRNSIHRRHVRGSNCLTPCFLRPRDAWAVETTDGKTVNWRPWVAEGEFWYVNPVHADVSPPYGYGRHSRRGTNGWEVEMPPRDFAPAIAEYKNKG